MWSADQIEIEIELVDGSVMIVAITTPVGVMEVCAKISKVGNTLHVVMAHVEGLEPGRLGRSGLNAIGRKILAEAGVEEVIIEGGARTTGRNKGRPPRVIRFPRR